ncbi:2OG-Fe dioxygenase family protein [Endozoicomonas elysicola]|uniref:2OG-Fe dioxygenase family protein n=1 Tax=Endozoicomonas elysicola TaxID=305900 RepID=A0A081KCW3_9GAMM|nr:2OG-Fe dioxygenase family protein [Endozoicomonas elysicola]KEI71989.1 hypothetical protein GV64_15765 [Endozoicomonas elysicola]
MGIMVAPYREIREVVHSLSNTLSSREFITSGGSDITRLLNITREDIQQFGALWSDLKLDQYMADGGFYRYRRYGQFELNPHTLEKHQLPHEPYFQPGYINTLNGDLKRTFEPLTVEFARHHVLDRLIRFLAEICNGASGRKIPWNVRLHPYRIVARKGINGMPTPEGLHRDGVTFISSILIRRHNVLGGVTTITDADRKPLTDVQLTHPFDLMLANDEATMHSVSSISMANSELSTAYRDVLVIAFTQP